MRCSRRTVLSRDSRPGVAVFDLVLVLDQAGSGTRTYVDKAAGRPGPHAALNLAANSSSNDPHHTLQESHSNIQRYIGLRQPTEVTLQVDLREVSVGFQILVHVSDNCKDKRRNKRFVTIEK